jgi:DNA-binding response OmpR family regulator
MRRLCRLYGPSLLLKTRREGWHLPRILIVDDDAQFRRTMRIALTALGHEISEAAGGAEALDLISARAPDLVLLDWFMPGMGGLETCRAIHTRSQVPVVVVSSDRLLTKAKVGVAGATDFLAKPFSITDLLAHIDAALKA